MDQIVKDLHHSGYPSVKMYEDAAAIANPALYGDGLVSVGSGLMQFEGDVDGTGTVSEVFVQLTPVGGPCPCTLQRGAVSKQTGRRSGTVLLHAGGQRNEHECVHRDLE